MDYRQFVCAVEKQMNKKMTGGVKTGLHTAVKNNGKERTGVLIETPGVNISPTIYLEEYYENYLNGVPVEKIVEEIISFYSAIKQEKSWDYEKILCYEGVKDRIVFKLINAEQNRKFLSTVPHMGFLDLAIVFYVLLEVTKEGTAAMTVSLSHMEQWQVGTDMLWEDALNNVKRLLPAEFFTMNYALKEILKKSTVQDNTSASENLLLGNVRDRDGMYVLTNHIRNYGASCIAYPHLLEMIGNILEADFYVLPSSVHEVVITPRHREISCEELDEMVKDINETQVEPEEVLSNHAYLYERGSGRLRIGTEREPGRMMG
nr:DUF5688 family protein [uncultured Mediterraneibacter sp.]